MPRTTAELVGGIIEVDLDTPIDVDPFIEVANAIVTERCAGALKSDGSLYYDTTRLELIERWLSAHFYAIRDPRATHEQVEQVEAHFQSKVDLGFNVTHYGQMAMRLDTAGGLAALDAATINGGARRAGSSWLGTKASEIEGTLG